MSSAHRSCRCLARPVRRRLPGLDFPLRPIDKLLAQPRRLDFVVGRGRVFLQRRLHLGGQVGAQEFRPEGREELAIELPRVLEADLELCRMDVHINLVGRHFQGEDRDREAADHEETSVRLAQRVLQRAVADRPSVEEKVLHPVVAAALARMGDIT